MAHFTVTIEIEIDESKEKLKRRIQYFLAKLPLILDPAINITERGK